MNIKFLFRIIFLLFFLPLYLNASNLYVSPGGNDNNNGSISSPFKTITHALELASSGDTVILRGGTYNEAVRIRISNITLKAYPGENPTISTPIDQEEIDTTLTIDVDADGTIIDGIEITGGYYYGIALFTKWDWNEEDTTGATHVTIKNCKIHDTGRDCVKLTPQCDYVTIENCEIYNSGKRNGENAEGIDNVNCDYMTVRNCYIHDISTNGLYVKGGGINAIIEKNIIVNCGEMGVGIGFDTSPEYFDTVVNPRRFEAINGIVKNCLIVNTNLAGIGFYAAKDSKAINNTLINVATEDQSAIYFGITLQDWEPDSDPNDGIGYRPPNTNIVVRNNIVREDSSISTPTVFIRTFYHEGDVGRVNGYEENSMPDIDYNCYYYENGNPAFTDQRPGHEVENINLSQWRSHVSNEEHSFSLDPELDENYKLTASSPCIDAGDSTVDITDDLEGNIRNVPFDIGAYEYNSNQNNATGDVDGNTHITSVDLVIMLNVVAGNISEGTAPCTNPGNGDFNNSGNIDTSDCIYLANILSENIKE